MDPGRKRHFQRPPKRCLGAVRTASDGPLCLPRRDGRREGVTKQSFSKTNYGFWEERNLSDEGGRSPPPHSENFNDVWHTEDGREWIQATNRASWSPRFDFQVASFNDHLWIVGGEQHSKIGLEDIWVSGDGTHWSEVTNKSLWVGVYRHQMTEFNGKLWLLGGVNFSFL